MRLVTAAEMRAIDRAAIEECGVAGGELMERAGAAVARAAHAYLGPKGRVLVLCGAGNNGGDGYVAARHLRAEGVDVRVAAVAPSASLRGDALSAREAAVREGVPILEEPAPETLEAGLGDVLLDALFGTGLSRAPEGAPAEAIARIGALRQRGAKVVAVDVPSGLSADTGRPLGRCVHADATVTFGFHKRGLVLHPGPAYAGEVVLADIGIPARAATAVPVGCELLTEDLVRALVPPRPPEAHKGDAGRVLVLAGSPGHTGAAQLALLGALRGGAGLVTLAARAEVVPLALAHRPEAMSAVLPGQGALGLGDLEALLALVKGMDALVIGPGIPRGPATGALLRALLERARVPAAIDADALNALAETPGGPRDLGAPAVLTPHPGEMARLTGRTIAMVQADRIGLALESARAWGSVVVLKGARTVVAAPSEPPAVVPTGNPGMATGGTGDVLAGLTGALLASGLAPFAAARVAAFAHGAAGDLAAERWGERGLLASDLADELGPVWARWDR
ncbi:MAG TPA: NAD(P)H-hydrate dehydratase [Anaeromyxobacteraceae bacterium]|nr:NAD(P)H-hydrate dehydratase [Anaeromyxobacteraceae bacterium]